MHSPSACRDFRLWFLVVLLTEVFGLWWEMIFLRLAQPTDGWLKELVTADEKQSIGFHGVALSHRINGTAYAGL